MTFLEAMGINPEQISINKKLAIMFDKKYSYTTDGIDTTSVIFHDLTAEEKEMLHNLIVRIMSGAP